MPLANETEQHAANLIAQLITQWGSNTLPDYRAAFKKTGDIKELAEYIVFELKCAQFRIGERWPVEN